MNVECQATDAPPGVAVVDNIERRRVQLTTPAPVAPRDTDTERFLFPVDAACSFETRGLRFDRRDEIFVRDADGNLISRVRSHERQEFSFGTYTIEISGPIKLYVLVADSLTVSTGADYIEIDFDNFPVISIGARSYHEHPATTLTVPDDPRAMMEAFSAMSSALKTTSPERAYPTLRGHPPLLELGGELDIPHGISGAGTGVGIIVPPEYETLFPVAPLAFYLGAEVVPGSPARITTDRGFEHVLSDKGVYEDEVARVLKQTLFLDCLVRTAGFYQVDLYEREMVEDSIPFDIDALYDEPLEEQLAEYLRVPFGVVEPALPRWCLTANLPMTAEYAEAIPYVVNELGVIRQPHGRKVGNPAGAPAEADATGDDPDRWEAFGQDRSPESALERSRRRERADELAFVEPATTDESVEHAWFGDHVPLGATMASIEAYRNKLARSDPGSVIDITVVCNDPWMVREREALDTVYGFRDDLPYSIDSRYQTTCEELLGILEGECDFLHYIGDATAEGLECRDGYLDTAGIDDVGVESFLLNANRTVTQALGLIENGAVGGVGILSEVDDDSIVEIGRAMAHLLNLGFTLRSAVEVVQEYTAYGENYLLVGAGNIDIAQVESNAPLICKLERLGDSTFELAIKTYPMPRGQIGSTFVPDLESSSFTYLFPGEVKQKFILKKHELQEYLRYHSYPVTIDDSLYWNNTLDTIDL